MLKSIKVENWKAFESFNVSFLDGLNFFVGRNATGKTSLLEAISVALVGKALTVSDPKILVRDADKPAIISLDFIHESANYTIERTLTKYKLVSSKLIRDNQVIERSWEGVSTRIMELLGVSRISFERILYLSEGDLFRFITSPAREGMTKEIEETLGINRMEGLLEQIKFEQKSQKGKEESIIFQENQFKKIVPLKPNELETFKQQAAAIEKEIEEKEIVFQESSRRYQLTESKIIKLQNVKKHVFYSMEQLQRISVDKPIDFTGNISAAVSSGLDKVNNDCENIEKLLFEDMNKLGNLQARKDSMEMVIRLLTTTVEGKEHDHRPCPICNKEITDDEAVCLMHDRKDNLDNLLNAITVLEKEIKANRLELSNFKDVRVRLIESRSRLVESLAGVQELNVPPDRHVVEAQLDIASKELNQLRTEREKITDNINSLRNNFKEITSKIERGQVVQELRQSEDIERNLVSVSKSEMALDLLEVAFTQAIANQREQKMKPVCAEIENIWHELKNDGSTILINEDTMPVLCKNGQKFTMQQLSGGEKMALFVIMRTILCRKFTNANFMMLDEPLEHLDATNRQFLIDFLVEYFDKGWIDQLVITTFEESILRKLSNHAQVNIIAL